jgi:large subunit ribosomal protein L3
MAIEGIIGKKVGMTQVFAEDGALVPVTVIQAGPCLVVQKKTSEKDGYDAVQIGLVEKVSNRRITSAQRGHFEKAGVQPVRTLAEVPYSGDANVGDRVTADMFKAGDSIDVVGQSKGKGFQGVVRRHGFGGGRESHGSMFHRAPGSIGASAFPSRVMKGMRMAGRMGGSQVTVKNLRVAKVDAENNLLYIRGAVPGAKNGLVYIGFSRNGKRSE